VFGSKTNDWVPTILTLLLLPPICRHCKNFTLSVRWPEKLMPVQSMADRDRIIRLMCKDKFEKKSRMYTVALLSTSVDNSIRFLSILFYL
jgi:hypothetical protein